MFNSKTFRFIGLFLLHISSKVEGRGDSRKINIENLSGSKVEIHWVHPQTDERVLQSSPFVYHGASFELNSFVTHTFEARELPGKSGSCKGENETCRIGFFTVNENDSQAVTIDSSFDVKHVDNKSIARESAQNLLEDCQKSVITAIEDDSSMEAKDAVKMVTDCVSESVALEMEKANEEISFQANIRTQIADHFENATCADYDLKSTDPVDTNIWRHNGISRKVDVLLERAASKVHVISNFISAEECNAMEESAKSSLHRATVADGKGGSELSPNRKAMQAGIKIPWQEEEQGNPLTTVSRKVYDYVNHVLGLDIDEHGQEDLMSIQYFGRGENDTVPDRYMPHCDGDCNGMPHKEGQRMATIVMYCTIPEKGGATNFRNAGLHVVPAKFSATFFSYIDPDTFKMDRGFTEHSGCPVIEGEKKIVTQWVRYGVDSENPWDSFNTLGIKTSDAAKQ